MTSKQIYLQLENIISKNLYISYNANCPRIYCKIYQRDQAKAESFNFYNFDIQCDNAVSQSVLSHWRFPSTRIYLNHLSMVDLEISELYYRGFSVILLKNHNASTNFKAKISLKSKNARLYSIDDHAIFKSHEISTEKTSHKGFVISRDKKIDGNNLISVIRSIFEKEKQTSPVSRLATSDLKFLKEVDNNWAEIPFKDDFEKFCNDSINCTTIAILIGEIDFVAGMEAKRFKNDLKKETGFFYKNLIEQNYNSESLYNSIQQFWDTISLPVKSRYLIDLMTTKSYEILAFLILAYRYNFWWVYRAYDRIHSTVKVLNPDFRPIFNLVFAFKNIFGVTKNQESLFLNPGLVKKKQTYGYSSDQLEFKKTLSSKKDFLYLRIYEKSVLIDQCVLLNYDSLQNIFYIWPFSYPVIENIKFVNIKTDTAGYHLPLCWEKFVLNAGNVRFKFLFKKTRYQVSIKAAAWVKKIIIDGREITFKNGMYQKIYIDGQKGEGLLKSSFYDRVGRTLNIARLPKKGKALVIQAVAIDRNGFLQDQINYKTTYSKTHLVNALSNMPEMFIADDPFSIWMKKLPGKDYEPSFTLSILDQIKNTETDVLQFQLGIYCDNMQIHDQIKKSFKKLLNMNVTIQNIDKIQFATFKFTIVVAAKNDLTITSEKGFEYHNECLLKNKAPVKIIQIEENKFAKWIGHHFS